MKLRDQIPDLHAEGEWINTRGIRTEDLIGHKPTLIYFWSVSCHTCKRAMPLINQMRDEFKRELQVLSIHTPLTEDDKEIESIKKEAEKFNITEPLFADQSEMLSRRFQIRYVPAYFIFTKEGELKHFQSGRNGIAMLRRRLGRILE
ncbi:TlpA family protein disulfide reductase [Oceanobacillus saliphilus]|uniref:TlpA family protein disulfide reductase n=1 Tax=Oceanobacillus saliphilus TaxID=2925834 RepID=UPI00201D9006|nr:TlpA disulfide reductase family protein [Oceanobacillus saliphilus]